MKIKGELVVEFNRITSVSNIFLESTYNILDFEGKVWFKKGTHLTSPYTNQVKLIFNKLYW